MYQLSWPLLKLTVTHIQHSLDGWWLESPASLKSTLSIIYHLEQNRTFQKVDIFPCLHMRVRMRLPCLDPVEGAKLYHWTTEVSQLNLCKYPGSYFVNGR